MIYRAMSAYTVAYILLMATTAWLFDGISADHRAGWVAFAALSRSARADGKHLGDHSDENGSSDDHVEAAA